ncbi:MAG TPA: hypothetical protein PLN21_11655 [Gemmatales bacterium]|nr:hypothetical protein [Gemmatales bacterium]
MARKSMRRVDQRYRHFGARVVLPFSQTPMFPTRCPGCDEMQPKLKWTPPAGMSPFAGNAQYFGNHNMLPAIEIPVCEVCIDHMPGRTQELSGLVASHLAPMLMAAATIFFYSVQLYAVATLTGLAAIAWFALAMKAVWVVDQSTLFDLQVGKNDSLLYYFHDPEYAEEFNRLNDQPIASAQNSG